jgi:hypothetical protein
MAVHDGIGESWMSGAGAFMLRSWSTGISWLVINDCIATQQGQKYAAIKQYMWWLDERHRNGEPGLSSVRDSIILNIPSDYVTWIEHGTFRLQRCEFHNVEKGWQAARYFEYRNRAQNGRVECEECWFFGRAGPQNIAATWLPTNYFVPDKEPAVCWSEFTTACNMFIWCATPVETLTESAVETRLESARETWRESSPRGTRTETKNGTHEASETATYPPTRRATLTETNVESSPRETMTASPTESEGTPSWLKPPRTVTPFESDFATEAATAATMTALETEVIAFVAVPSGGCQRGSGGRMAQESQRQSASRSAACSLCGNGGGRGSEVMRKRK